MIGQVILLIFIGVFKVSMFERLCVQPKVELFAAYLNNKPKVIPELYLIPAIYPIEIEKERAIVLWSTGVALFAFLTLMLGMLCKVSQTSLIADPFKVPPLEYLLLLGLLPLEHLVNVSGIAEIGESVRELHLVLIYRLKLVDVYIKG